MSERASRSTGLTRTSSCTRGEWSSWPVSGSRISSPPLWHRSSTGTRSRASSSAAARRNWRSRSSARARGHFLAPRCRLELPHRHQGPSVPHTVRVADADQASRTRAVVADDEVLLREGLVGLLEQGGYDVVGQAGDGSELIRLVREHQPDLAIVDIRMPPTHSTEGLEAASTIREE